ncbi:MAG: DNA translocase FtsK [Verrucomicrobia bacterium]|nr:DNA translocase FtsK [Verrucomicrobiota bacterium]
MPKPSPRNRPAPPPSSWSEAPAIAIFFLGLILFLSLVSYDPGDLPPWMTIGGTSTPNSPARNFIGPIGAILAGTTYFLIGAAGYLVAVFGVVFGASRVFTTTLRLTPGRVGWMLLSIVAAACLVHLQPWFLTDWKARFNIDGPGGFTGHWLGEKLLRDRLLGTVGSGIALGAVYLCSVVLLFGLHPIAVMRRIVTAFGEWREQRRIAAEEAATAAERMELERLRLEREQRRLEKAARRAAGGSAAAGVPPPAEAEEEEPAEETVARPKPQIIDSNAVTPATRKPSLAEVLGRGKGAREGALGATGAGDVRFANYALPSTELLDAPDLQNRPQLDPEELLRIQGQIVECLDHFGIKVSAGDITRGPTITRYEVYPSKGVRVDRIVALERDIARATRAERINILAPIPGKDTVGIEIANSRKVKVALRELLESDDWEKAKETHRIPLALGKDIYGKTIIADLAAMPHLLVAGTTGSGKSVCINSIIASLLYRFSPEQLRFIMIDPKVVEMQHYNELPHLAVPVVTDPKKVLLALGWVVGEMEKRYQIFAKAGVRNITGYNSRPRPKSQAELDAEAGKAAAAAPAARATAAVPAPAGRAAQRETEPVVLAPEAVEEEMASPVTSQRHYVKMHVSLDGDAPARGDTGPTRIDPEMDDAGVDGVTAELMAMDRPAQITPPSQRNSRDEDFELPEKMPYIVVIVDELADLMQTAPADVEAAIARITQMARAAGIHMIVATQTPRADVVTGIIKANIPSRIAFQVASKIDSRVILDENGAERLLGQGDMLYLPPGTSRMTRAQGVFVTDEEIHRLVKFAGDQGKPNFEVSIQRQLESDGDDAEEDVTPEDEELVQRCLEIIRQERKASTSMLQRRLRLGYTRAARVVDILEARGILGPDGGAKGREILVDLDRDL